MPRKPTAAPSLGRRPLVHRDPARLVGYDRNARTHSPEQVSLIRASIDTYGPTNPILIDEDDHIIAGHGRRDAALLDPALREFPCIVLSGLSPTQKRALIIADNKIALNAGWDLDLLRTELADLQGAGVDLGTLGFSPEEAKIALAFVNKGLTDPDEAPPLEQVAVAQAGDVWELGLHRLVCGSSTDRATVQLALDGCRPHLMVTDPPYGVNYDPTWRKKAGISSPGAATGAVMNDDRSDWREAWVLFPGAVAYVWHGGLHAGSVADSLAATGFAVRAQIVWVKGRPALSRGHYHWQHEPCAYAVRDEDDHWRFTEGHELVDYAVREGQTGAWQGGRKQSTVWFIEHIKSETGHSTQKPIEAMRRPLENNSQPGDHVYEPFSGSGTLIIAGEMTGRIVHAIELNPLYVDVAIRRWQAFTGQKARRQDGVAFEEASMPPKPTRRRKAA